ncbi:APC family permease [Mesoplasma lactucae]|uniref:Amino acid permease n=1 Tax=Mesoplasma lactucae ATCC 49193 TaxID=81460 RepID=A0A291IS14_9MOLU|nr:APC family permease [Mesoplasma lactucae]ATG97725.1 amino acid permease [Mesoplasma lactucae ATCC 49193]ATZ20500.1 amino acid permease [Mesoplasma lactucae ATCC 49193]MCL8216671.1 hypothetical protein [Mesoplasma lactucae ATCC 49193]
MKKKGNRKAFEFLTLFVMVIGSVIGAGIYIKNSSIVKETGNPIIAIILWVIVGIICTLAIIVFMEIASATKDVGNGTAPNWAKIFINRKTASFFSLVYTIILWPSYYSLFAGTFVYYMLVLIGVDLSAGSQLAIYLSLGIFLLVGFYLFNGLLPKYSKWVQIGGNIFKFIPLLIALVAGFCMIDSNSAMFNGGFNGAEWSEKQWEASSFFRGFGGILLSFDAFYFIANSQKTAKNKDVVPKALFVGMVFAALFYVLMAVSLFLGSPDGSIFELFAKMFGEDSKVSAILPPVLMMIICLLSINMFTAFGMANLESDVEAKLVYVGKRRGKVSLFKCGSVQIIFTVIVYVAFTLMGFFIPRAGYSWGSFSNYNKDGILAIADQPTDFLSIMGSVAAILSFVMVDILIFACLVNRKTNKVKVDRYKGVPVLGTISGIAIAVFIIGGLYTYIDVDPKHVTPFKDTIGLYFLILFIAMLAIVTIAFFIQEALFKKYPFKDGFDGYLEGEDPIPFFFKINPIQNYFTKKGEEEIYDDEHPRSHKRSNNK